MTAAVITPETKDTPTLTVTISKLSSSSPFPSPGSPFLPPPIPSAHEYALISPLSKRRSIDSRMNVGSKTDREAAAAAAAATTASPAAAGKALSSPVTESPLTVDQRKDSKDVASGNGNGNGLVASFAGGAEPGQLDAKATTNGQVTTTTTTTTTTTPTPTLKAKSQNNNSAASQPLTHNDTPNARLSTPSTPDDDDDDDACGSPSTPLPSSTQKPPMADHDERSPSTSNPPSSFVATTATTEDIATTTKPSSDATLKSSRSGSLRSSRDSLSSSRPAPPSPADSRRASTALSRHSSTRSRPGSITSLTPASTYNPAEGASPTTPTPTQLQHQQHQAGRGASTSSTVASSQTTIVVKIRDYAFPDEDVRHTGTGPLTPRPNRKLQRPLSTWSTSSTSSAGSSEDQHDDGAIGAGGSSYGFSGWGLGRLSWFGARAAGGAVAGGSSGGMGGSAGGGAGGGDVPSQGDFARNFTDASPECEIDDPYDSLGDEDDEGSDCASGSSDCCGREENDGGGERPLFPGLYRAVYAFEPEGTAEMALEEDQVVRVIGRGGGVGWAIVARGGDEGHALVPEGYLELVSLDRDQVGEEEEG